MNITNNFCEIINSYEKFLRFEELNQLLPFKVFFKSISDKQKEFMVKANCLYNNIDLADFNSIYYHIDNNTILKLYGQYIITTSLNTFKNIHTFYTTRAYMNYNAKHIWFSINIIRALAIYDKKYCDDLQYSGIFNNEIFKFETNIRSAYYINLDTYELLKFYDTLPNKDIAKYIYVGNGTLYGNVCYYNSIIKNVYNYDNKEGVYRILDRIIKYRITTLDNKPIDYAMFVKCIHTVRTYDTFNNFYINDQEVLCIEIYMIMRYNMVINTDLTNIAHMISSSNTNYHKFTYTNSSKGLNLLNKLLENYYIKEEECLSLKAEFKSKYNRIPKIIRVLETARLKYTKYTEKEFVSKFRINSIKTVAKTNSDVLCALAIEYDLSAIVPVDVLGLYRIINTTVNDILFSLHYIMSSDKKKYSIYSNFIKYIMKNLNKFGKSKGQEIVNMINNLSIIQDCSTFKEAKAKLSKAKGEIEKNKFENEYKWFNFEHTSCSLEDNPIEDSKYKAYILKSNDVRQFSAGIDTNCCYKYNGAAESSLIYSMIVPESGTFVIEDKVTNCIKASSWLWISDKGHLIFDNIEFSNNADISKYINILYRYVENSPYDTIYLGLGYNELNEEYFSKIISQFELQDNFNDKYEKLMNNYYKDVEDSELYSDFIDNNVAILKENGKMLLLK